MNEKQLIAAVLRQLPDTIHSQSMTFGSLSTRGTPDRYFDGPLRDFWVEFKMLRAMPRSGIVKGDYSELQLRWMTRRYANSVKSCTYTGLPKENTPASNMFGVVGLPNRTAVIQRTPTEWRNGSPIGEAMTIKEVASCLERFGCL